MDQLAERFDEHVFAEPEEDEAAEQISHTEETDTSRAGNKYYHQSKPEWIEKHGRFDVVQIRPNNEAIQSTLHCVPSW